MTTDTEMKNRVFSCATANNLLSAGLALATMFAETTNSPALRDVFAISMGASVFLGPLVTAKIAGSPSSSSETSDRQLG